MTASVLKVSEAASIMGVSDDTVRRWAESGRITLTRGDGGRQTVDGGELAALAQELAAAPTVAAAGRSSTRNHLTGLVTRITKDTVMAQVELQAGPFRLVALISREAADELGLEVGTLAAATVKATSVGITLP